MHTDPPHDLTPLPSGGVPSVPRLGAVSDEALERAGGRPAAGTTE